MSPQKSLHEEMAEFRRWKKYLITALIVLGIAGLIFPIIPGLALLFLGFMFIFPKQGEEILEKIKKLFQKEGNHDV